MTDFFPARGGVTAAKLMQLVPPLNGSVVGMIDQFGNLVPVPSGGTTVDTSRDFFRVGEAVPAAKLMQLVPPLNGTITGGLDQYGNLVPIPAGGGAVTKTDRSGSITTGGQARVLMAANSARRGWSLQNKSLADMWFNDVGGVASKTDATSVYLPAGSFYESEYSGPSASAISLYCDVTGSQFAAREW